MAKKKPLPNLNGLIAGYLRISDVKFPDGCVSVPDKEAFLDKLRQIRMSELMQDAERDGCTIDIWYDDIGISGRGEYLAKRIAYQEMLRDAKAKKLRAVYARDLSRLGRDLIEQENFFLQLEAQAVDVRVADLPTSGDEAARTLVRQQLGSLNQYMATKNGQVIKQTNLERVRTGQWVGRTRDQLGLRYNKATKFFDYDPETADLACLVYETFIACHGFARATALTLNQMLRDGKARAAIGPRGGMWSGSTVLRIIKGPIYRRKIQYEDLLIDSEDKIPAVVPQDLVDEVDRLLLVRAPLNEVGAAKRKAGRLEHTFGGMLFCIHCGRRMIALRNPGSRAGRGPVLWLSWICCQGGDGERGLCDCKFSIQQFRLDALVSEGLRQAFEIYEREHFKSGKTPKPKPVKPLSTFSEMMAKLDQRRDRLLDLLESCEPEAVGTINERLKAIANERIKLKEQPEVTAELAADTTIETLSRRQLTSLSKKLETVWETPDDMLSHAKHDLLKTLQVRVMINILPRAAKKRKDGNTRRYPGLLSAQLHVGILGMAGEHSLEITETQDAYNAYIQWKCCRRW
ncbi:hypothetical protein CCAX7_000750 [Capsulimonas corticalis]|uniref:Uncharacterized protein n=1 Tax=Capsulimonas corticalis TaxID=2219043 RepID=A0A402CRH7_9BACT|nr:recombinase family protein [Capsulimonas corticalis]BDI28024.1 hypothetical protein CCAX7_000750 [Capsulimonas corticalis]